jgi:endogenous inhibitor of DNA gyrase (YacG/DUF329 family)
MVEILKRGTPPAEARLTRECRRCGTEFRFTRSEATFHTDQRDGDYLEIACPVCGKPVTVAT